MRLLSKESMVALMLGGFLVSGIGIAQAEFDGNGPSPERKQKMQERFDKMATELGLTDEQKKAVTLQKQNKMEVSKALREQAKQIKEQLRSELDKPNTDNARVDALINQAGDIHKQILRQRANSVLEMKKVLTPEQYVKFQQKMQDKKDKWKNKKKGNFSRHEGPEGGPEPDME